MTEGGDGTVGYHHSITGKKNISISKKGKRYISETHDCKFCNQLYATRQLPVHERSCESNPNKISGIGTGRTTDIKTTFCQYCNIEFKRTSMGRHERTCNANPNKEIIEYKRYKQKTSTCEHCNKTGGIGIMKRYHHDNCRVSVRV